VTYAVGRAFSRSILTYGGCGMKRKKLVVLFLATAFALTVAAPASADKPKFNPNDNACQGPNDQNNCPGGPH
jgi:hypothetical protein